MYEVIRTGTLISGLQSVRLMCYCLFVTTIIIIIICVIIVGNDDNYDGGDGDNSNNKTRKGGFPLLITP